MGHVMVKRKRGNLSLAEPKAKGGVVGAEL